MSSLSNKDWQELTNQIDAKEIMTIDVNKPNIEAFEAAM